MAHKTWQALVAVRQAFRVEACELMDKHGLQNWNVWTRGTKEWKETDEFNNKFAEDPSSVTDYLMGEYDNHIGFCSPVMKTLVFDVNQTVRWSPTRRRELILHEIAHALLPEHGHDEAWASKAEEIGVRRRQVTRDLAAASDTENSTAPFRRRIKEYPEPGRTRLEVAQIFVNDED